MCHIRFCTNIILFFYFSFQLHHMNCISNLYSPLYFTSFVQLILSNMSKIGFKFQKCNKRSPYIFNILRYYNLDPNLLIAPAKPNHAFDWSPKFIIQAMTHSPSRHWLPTPCINNSTVLHLYDIILSTPCIVFSVRYYAN